MKNTKEAAPASPSKDIKATGFGDVARQASIRFSGLAFDKLIGYVFALFVASYYGSDAFGLYLFGIGVIDVILGVTRLGMERAEVREVARLVAEGRISEIKGVVRTALKLTLPLSLILAAAVFLLSRPLAAALGDVELETFLRFAAPAILLSTISDVMLWATEGQGDQRFLTLTRLIVEPLIRLTSTVVFFITLREDADERFLAFAYAIAQGVSAALGYFFYHRRVARRAPEDVTGSYAAELLRVGLPFCGTVVLTRLIARAEVLLLFAFLSASATAEFALAQRTALLATMIAFAVEAAFRPTIARSFAQGRYDQAQAQFLCVSRSTLMLGLPACIILALFPVRVMSVVGEQFVSAAPVVTLIAIGAVVTFAFGPVASALAMAGLTQKNLKNGLIAGAVGLALDLVLIPRIGIVGAAIAQLVSMTVLAVISAVSAYRATGVLGLGRAHLKLVVASLVAAGVGLLADTVAPANKYMAFVVIATSVLLAYVITLALIRPVEEDWQLIKSVFVRQDGQL